MRWLYARLGIASSAPVSRSAVDAGTSGLDEVLDSQLELCDYAGSSNMSDTRLRDSRPKAGHGHAAWSS